MGLMTGGLLFMRQILILILWGHFPRETFKKRGAALWVS